MEIDKYLNREDWLVKENSNISYSLQALNLYLAGKEVKKYWLSLYGGEITKAHDDGYFHCHDLTGLSNYCGGYSLEDVLYHGFGVDNQSKSKPPKHLSSALGQLVNFLFSLSQEISGAVAVSSFDTLLAPFIKEDSLTYEEVKQQVQEFIFNMNVATRVGGQRVFSNLTIDLVAPNKYKTKKVLIAGQKKDYCYGDCQEEMNMINKALAEVMITGDAHGKVFSFPIITVNLTKDFDWTNFKELWDLTGKYGAYTFANYINSDMDPEDSRSLCCRLRLDSSAIPVRRGGLFGIESSTGSVGVCTISLPMLAVEAGGCKEKFLTLLNYYTNLAKSSLEIKRRVIEDLTEKGLYPYNKQVLQPIKDEAGGYWSNHFSTIGIIGAHEACINMFGKGIEDQDSKAWVVEVMNYLRDKMVAFKAETGHLYNLEASPCFSGITKITIKHRNQNKIINIADLQKYNIDDVMVLTKDGFKKIKRLIINPYDGYLLKVKLRNGADMNVTDEHPCVVLGDNGYIIKRADELTADDYMAFDTSPMDGSAGDYDLGRYVGLYAAEGCYSDNYIKFTFNINETEYAKFIEDFSRIRFGAYTKTQICEDTHARKVYVWGDGAKGTVLDFVTGREATVKGLSSTIMNTSIEFRRGFVDGIWEGDGQKKSGGALHISSPDLIRGVAAIMNSTGERYTLTKKIYNHKPNYYLLRINGDSPLCNTQKRYIQRHGFSWLKIESIERKHTKVRHVYDIEIDTEDHLFKLSNGIVVHNCEGAGYSLAQKALKKYPNCAVQGEKDNAYFTNSTHLPVNYTGDIFEILEHQEDLQKLYTGGTTINFWLAQSIDGDQAKMLVKKIAETYSLPYFTLSPVFSSCVVDGFISGEHKECPKCGGETEVYTRIVGYFSPISLWNKGKLTEFGQRLKYNGDLSERK